MLRFILLIAVALAAACGPPPVETLCDSVAASQCERCFACGDGAALCGLPDGADQADCEVELGASCSNQAATLTDPKEAISTCDESLPDLTCDTLVEARALDLPGTTPECQYLL